MLDESFLRLIIGPYGSGKSVGCVMEIIRRASSQAPDRHGTRRSKFACVRNSYRQLDDTTLATFLEWLPDGVFGRYAKSSRTYHMKFDLPDGTRVKSEILFRALDKPSDQKKVLSLELTGAWFNEFREIPIALMTAMVGRCRWKPRSVRSTWNGIIADSNPPDKNSAYWRLMEMDEVPEGVEDAGSRQFFNKFRQPSGRGPDAENVENLVPGYYENMVRMAILEGKGDNWVRVHVDGEYGYTVSGTPVYLGSFNPSFHLATDLVPNPRRTIGIGYDPGLSYTAAVIGQMSDDSRWRIFRSILATNITVDEMIRRVEAMLVELGYVAGDAPRPMWFLDPASRIRGNTDKKSPKDIIAAAKYPVRIGEKGIDTRINAVRGLFDSSPGGEPRILIDKNGCPSLVEGLVGGYHFKEVLNGKGEVQMEPNKNQWSHEQDALQYLTSPFEVVRGKGAERKWPGAQYSAGPWATRPPERSVMDFDPHTLFA